MRASGHRSQKLGLGEADGRSLGGGAPPQGGGAGGLALQTWQLMGVMTTDEEQACLACLWEAE